VERNQIAETCIKISSAKFGTLVIKSMTTDRPSNDVIDALLYRPYVFNPVEVLYN